MRYCPFLSVISVVFASLSGINGAREKERERRGRQKDKRSASRLEIAFYGRVEIREYRSSIVRYLKVRQRRRILIARIIKIVYDTALCLLRAELLSWSSRLRCVIEKKRRNGCQRRDEIKVCEEIRAISEFLWIFCESGAFVRVSLTLHYAGGVGPSFTRNVS